MADFFKSLIRKLSSRKLWMAIAGVATGISMALGVDGSEISTVAGAVTALISVVTYIITEGKVDAASVQNTVQAVQNGLEVIQDASDNPDDGHVVVTGFGGGAE